ncbi:MAG: hypothetical protein ACN6OQ_09920, partial [Paraburkholderia nemoris]
MPLSQGTSPGAAAQQNALKQGVFLHTGWRSAGTWVWSRLRALDSATGFYEPFSNVLADLSVADVLELTVSEAVALFSNDAEV